MSAQFHLFEVCWEVANGVGGLHTWVSTRAKSMVEQFGDRYVAVGPWFPKGDRAKGVFDPESGSEAFEEVCRGDGLPVRVGRWRVAGRPRAILVDFAALMDRKDAILSRLWKTHQVESLFGEWEYVEAVLFGQAAGMAIERWWEEASARHPGGAVAQFHEWSTAAGSLYLHERVPSIATVLTIHGTVLGRSLGASATRTASGASEVEEERGEALGVHSEHSLERAAAREVDVLTAGSDPAAEEVARHLTRRVDAVIEGGIDVQAMAPLSAPAARAEAAATLRRFAAKFLNRDVSEAALIATSGRYLFEDKGLDLLLDAAAILDRRPGRPIVLFLLMPTAVKEVRREVLDRLEGRVGAPPPLPGVLTHVLARTEGDPILARCARLGLDNAAGRRVCVIWMPGALRSGDGLVNLPYRDAVSGMDVTCFPSAYEPWGTGPHESLALGVPTITSDRSGFGRWALAQELDRRCGVHAVPLDGGGAAVGRGRASVERTDSCLDLAEAIESFTAPGQDSKERAALSEACRRSASRASWSERVPSHVEACRVALVRAGERRAAIPHAEVEPRALPPPLAGLGRLARNLWWSWDAEATSLFEDLTLEGWRRGRHNPVRVLQEASPRDLAARAEDAEFVRRVSRVVERFDSYMASRPKGGGVTAYFSAEFGLHESLPIYSGGLGILSGDHLKSASDVGVPLVAVGLLYRKGRLRQRLTASGEQRVTTAEGDPRLWPADPVVDLEPDLPYVELGGRRVFLRAWRVHVGRVDLYLLDTDVEGNDPEDRAITGVPYPSDPEARLRLEAVLGVGGARLLSRLGIEPSALHMNEGHAAFAAVERAGRRVAAERIVFEEARERMRQTTAFTTHTAVPAGHDRFDEALVRRVLPTLPSEVGCDMETLLSLGHDEDGRFNMTRLALSFAGHVNGVSRIHAEVTREMLGAATPVKAITNGIHLPTWTSGEIARALGVGHGPVTGADFARAAPGLDPAALWAARSVLRRRLLAAVKRRNERRLADGRMSPAELDRAAAGLDEHALLVGFARRFAAYKRADLILSDMARLERLVASADRPVRIFYAGKAHPDDREGRAILKRVASAAREGPLAGRIFFLEDYGLDLSRSLVQGADVWLNNPRQRLEASGTSGMKSAANGGLNLSVPDGWWPEAFDGTNGWSIGAASGPGGGASEDGLDAVTLYRLLEEEVVPLFFDRGADGIPRRWLERAKRSLATIPPVFNTDRMVAEYASKAYRAP